MELTSFPCVLLCVHDVFLYFHLQWFVLGLPALDLSFVLRLGGAFHLLRIRKSKVSLLLFKFLLNFDIISIGNIKWGDVQDLHLTLDVLVYTVMTIECQMPLRILNTQICAKVMKKICELWHILVPSLSQHGPLYVFIFIDSGRLILFLDGISERIPSVCG